jgi:hypothetical protein
MRTEHLRSQLIELPLTSDTKRMEELINRAFKREVIRKVRDVGLSRTTT